MTFDTSKKSLVWHDCAMAGGFPHTLDKARIFEMGNLVWVDATNGNDGTPQRGRLQPPFLTLGAAKASAASGEIIVVVPGSDEEFYSVADRMSQLRDAIPISSDGVYCPACYSANTRLAARRVAWLHGCALPEVRQTVIEVRPRLI